MDCDFQRNGEYLTCKVCRRSFCWPTDDFRAECPEFGIGYTTITTYDDKALQVIDFLRQHGPSTVERVERFIGCNRVPGIMAGMVASGKLLTSTPTTQPDSLYSLPVEPPKSLSTMNLETAFDQSYVINLKRRTDRLKEFMDGFREKGWPREMPTVFAAIEGDKVGVPFTFGQGGGAFGCRQSHVRILEDCLMDDVPSVLVLEDDAELCDDFTAKCNEFLAHVPEDWDGIMLGGQHRSQPGYVSEYVDQCVNAQRTHAYIARGNYLQALHKRWADCEVHIDWRMEHWQHLFRVYCPKTWLIAQRGGRSDITGRVKPLETWSGKESSFTVNRTPIVLLLDVPKSILNDLRKNGIHTGYWRCNINDIDNGLIDVFKSPENQREEKLKEWQVCLADECAKDGLILGIYHPKATLDLVSSVIENVHPIKADSAEKALEQIFAIQK
jgi:hypothetical protein